MTPHPPTSSTPPTPGRSRLATMLADPQFWVPVAVLAAGILVLAWIR